MVEIACTYDGDLSCTVTHGPSGTWFRTDAPVDNRGQGRLISPTDLLAAAIGSCALTIMAIAAFDRGIELRGARVVVTKEMGAQPRRRIARLTCEFTLPAALDERERTVLERAAATCPVQASLGERTELVLRFRYV